MRRKARPLEASDIVIPVILGIWGLLILYPFYNSVVVSLVPQATYIRTPFLLYPKNITLNAYSYVFHSPTIWNGYKVTIAITVLGLAYNMILSVSMSYALSRRRFPGKALLLNIIIFTMFFQGGLIPFYLLVRSLGLINSIFSMILPYGVNTFYMLIMRNYFRGIPDSIEESAKIDGANDLTILARIIVPLSMPVIATVSLFFIVDRWNEWFFGLLFIRSVLLQPLQLVLRNIIMTVSAMDAAGIPAPIQQAAFPDGIKMAAIVVTMLPVMVIYPFIQKYFTKGIILGAIKS
jgi:putative aldouronate transport system permease protein